MSNHLELRKFYHQTKTVNNVVLYLFSCSLTVSFICWGQSKIFCSVSQSRVLNAQFRKALAFECCSPEGTIIRHLIFWARVKIKTFCKAKIFLEKLEMALILLEMQINIWSAAAVNIQKFPREAWSLTICHWSSQMFDLHAPSSTDVPVLLLNQPVIENKGGPGNKRIKVKRAMIYGRKAKELIIY